MPLSREVRRVVTTVDKSGKAVVLFDGDNPHAKAAAAAPDRVAPVVGHRRDAGRHDAGAPTARRATSASRRRRAARSSASSTSRRRRPRSTRSTLDYQHRIVGDHAPAKGLPPRHPLMHRTRTIDYAIIMAGEIDMLLDDTEIHFKAGDVLIQQGTNHAWVNRGSEPCRIAFVLIDAKEP